MRRDGSASYRTEMSSDAAWIVHRWRPVNYDGRLNPHTRTGITEAPVAETVVRAMSRFCVLIT